MKKIQLVDSFKPRKYQENIFSNSINKNSLIILPTGLGKTVIALMLATYYFNKNPNKKILFLAPTKPLVEQQKKSFEEFIKNKDDFNFIVLTGKINPNKRKEIYEKADFIFATPQIIENDILNNRINLNLFSLVIFDEIHRGTGNYAYTFIGENLKETNCKIIGLSASPGTSKEEILEIIEKFSFENLEIKTYEDKDVKPYVNETKIEYVKVELDENLKKILKYLYLTFKDKVNILQKLGFLKNKNPQNITKTDLLELQKIIQIEISKNKKNVDDSFWTAISITAALMKLSYGIELVESQSIDAAYNYFYEFFTKKNQTKAVESLKIDINFRNAFELIKKLKKENYKHPKLIYLKKIVAENILENKNLKIIIFNQYRDNANKIVNELNTLKDISSVLFVGQSKKGETGLSQKEQKKILDDFRNDKYNILVSTSIGEEGLDIPKVDLVIFYEPVPSAIRTIQRAGRTGRFSKGKVIILVANDTKDVAMSYVAKAKEKKMYKVLNELKETFFNKKNQEEGLMKFIKKNKKIEKNENKKKDIKIILFDFGGVLIKEGAFKKIINKYNKNYEEWKRITKNIWNKAICGKEYNFNDIIKISADFCNINVEEFKKQILENTEKILPEFIELIKNLKEKEYKIGLFSNNFSEIVLNSLNKNNLSDFFDYLFISDKIGYKKPEEEIYEYIISKLEKEKISPNQVLFIDDSQRNIEMASHFKFNTIIYTNYDNLRIELSNFNIISYNVSGNDEKIPVYIDTRENQNLMKIFSKSGIIKPIFKQLNVGDIIISEKIGIERKEKKDFVNSLIDGRLFKQLINLNRHFSRPILILEGEENLYTLRNINPKAIDSAISTIITDLRIPIIYSNNLEDTLEWVENISKRIIKKNKEVNISKSKNTEYEYILNLIGSVPKLNIISAKILLEHFKNIKNIVNASPEDLEKIKGIGPKKAKYIYEFFRKEIE